MRGFRNLFILLAAALLAGGCVQTGLGNLISSTASADPAPVTMGATLARGYRMLAEYELGITGDQPVAAHFREKSVRAETEGDIEPDTGAGEALTQAHATLMEARKTLPEGNLLKVAEAQLNYDCWAAREARDDESAQWCRERFYKAVEGIALKGTHYAVHFATGQEVPDEAAFSVIRQAAASFTDGELWRIHLMGYSDPKGNKNQKLLLAMRRALAVRNALAQNGVDLDKIHIEAAALDKKNDEARVDIDIVAAADDQKSNGTDITKIAPQYFGEDEDL